MSQSIQGAGAVPASIPDVPSTPIVPTASDPSSVLALATLQLEEAADRSRLLDRRDREVAREHRRAEIEDRRDAALMRLGGKIANAGASIAAASSSNDVFDECVKAAGKVASMGAEYKADSLDQDAAAERVVADTVQDAAESSGEQADTLQRFADKASAHMEEIARARHEATMAVLRA